MAGEQERQQQFAGAAEVLDLKDERLLMSEDVGEQCIRSFRGLVNGSCGSG